MPISKSAKKALRVATTKTGRNRYRKELLKDAIKAADATSFSMIDKAAKWGIIHENKAARLKSHLAKALGPDGMKSAKKATDTTPTKPKKAAKPAAKKTVKKTVKK